MTEKDRIKSMLKKSDSFTEFMERLEGSDIKGMPKISGGYITDYGGMMSACKELDKKARNGDPVSEVDKLMQNFTRSKGIRGEAREMYENM